MSVSFWQLWWIKLYLWLFKVHSVEFLHLCFQELQNTLSYISVKRCSMELYNDILLPRSYCWQWMTVWITLKEEKYLFDWSIFKKLIVPHYAICYLIDCFSWLHFIVMQPHSMFWVNDLVSSHGWVSQTFVMTCRLKYIYYIVDQF